MKYFLLIAGHKYYPSSCTGDWIDTYTTYKEAEDFVNNIIIDYDWYEIVDLRTWINR